MREIKIPLYPMEKTSLWGFLEREGILLNEYAKEYLTHPGFRLEEKGELALLLLSLTELGLPQGGRYEEIFAQVRRRGFRPCRPSAGLFLRLYFRSQAKSKNSLLSGAHRAPEGSITVLSDFLAEEDSFPKGLYLRNVEDRKSVV